MNGLFATGIDQASFNTRLLQRLQTFDEIVSWYGTNRADFRERLAQINPACRFLPALPPGDSGVHVSDFFVHSVDGPLGSNPRLEFEAVPKRATIVVQPFSGSLKKNWPLACFQTAVRQLPYPTEWIAGPEEHLEGALHIDDLYDLARFLAGARCFIGNDSGITHLAAACGVPTVAVFGPTNPRVWAPRGPHVHIVHSDPIDQVNVASLVSAAHQAIRFNQGQSLPGSSLLWSRQDPKGLVG